MVSNPENETSKTEESGMDEADSLTVRLEKSDQVRKQIV